MATAYFYPNADPESTSVDGIVQHYTAYDAGLAWANLVGAAGIDASDNVADASILIKAANASNEWMQLRRIILLFDTSTIPATSAIASASLRVYGYGKVDQLSITPDINVYSSNPVSNTGLAGGDFDSLGTAPFCDTAITYAAWNDSGYNTFTLNADGLVAIAKGVGGITKFGLMNANYDVAISAPPNWSNQKYSSLSIHLADQGTYKPRLSVTYYTIPVVSTEAASAIGGTVARLNGEVTDDGDEACEYRFRYKIAGGSYSYTTWAGSVETTDAFYEDITGLSGGTAYYFNAQIKNSAGESAWGAEGTFTTIEASTNAATHIEATTARLNGEVVYDGGDNCQYRFRYREAFSSDSYTNTTWTGSKTAGEAFYEDITSLTEDTTYEFAAQIKNTAGESAWATTLYFTCGTRSKTIGPIYDPKGRVPKGARVEARRADTGVVAETEHLDANGMATFDDLPNDTNVTFWVTWGGTTQALKTDQLFSTIIGVTEGGTGASDASAAKKNLGLGTNDSPQFTAIELGHATDTTIARDSAGKVSVEGTVLVRPANYVVAANNAPTHVKAQADYVCDATDDHVQIQAAIDALPATGGKVLLTEGTFNIETKLDQDSYQHIQGMGRSTILTTTTADLDILTATGLSGSEKVGLIVSDLCVDGNAGGATNDCGIKWTYVDDSKIDNVYSKDNGEHGIRLYLSDHNQVINCVCNGNTLHGIDVYADVGNIIANNTSYSNGGDGITVEQTSLSNIVEGNAINSNTENGIEIKADSDNNTIRGNACFLNEAYGIYVNGAADNNTISGNTCHSNSQGGSGSYQNIAIDSADYNLVSNNICRAGSETNKSDYAIEIHNGTGNKIINNDLYDDGYTTGEYLDSGTDTIYLESEDTRDFLRYFGDRTLLSGGAISAHEAGDGSVAIASCTAWCKETDADSADGVFFSYAGKAKQTLTDLTANLIYLDYNQGGTAVPGIVVATSPLDYGFQQDHILLGVVFQNGNETHILQADPIGIQGDNRSHMMRVEEGPTRSSGMATTAVTGTRNLDITAGVLHLGLNRKTTPPYTTPNTGADDYTNGAHPANKLYDADGGFVATDVGKIIHNTTDDTYTEVTAYVSGGELTLRDDIFVNGENYNLDIFSYWYYDGSLGTPAWVEDSGSTEISNSHYNDTELGLVEFTENRFGVHWVYMDFDGHLHVIYGQGDYKANEAEEVGVPASLPNIATGFAVLIAKIICQQGTDVLTITHPWTSVFTSTLATDHGSLGGLGDDDHTIYLLADGTRGLTGNMAVTATKTIDGRDISADGTKLDNVVSNTQAITHSISDNKTVTVDGTTNAPADDDYAKWTGSGLEGRSYSEARTDLAVPNTTTATTTLYVDAGSGNDENAGTSGSPKATIQGALDALPVVIAHACTIAVRGQQNYAESNAALDFSRFNTLATITLKTVNSSDEDMYDYGTADAGAGNNELDDATKDWSVDQFKGAYVWIFAGTGEGQVREIDSNTATKLTLTAIWTVNPDGTSEYAIGGGATLTGTSYHIVAKGKNVDVYGFKHTGGSYDIISQFFSTVNAYYNYHASSGSGAFYSVYAYGKAGYNYVASGYTAGYMIGYLSNVTLWDNVVDDATKGIRVYYMAFANGSASHPNHLMNCTTGISIESGSGMSSASDQSFGAGGDVNGDDILPAVSTTVPQWYT